MYFFFSIAWFILWDSIHLICILITYRVKLRSIIALMWIPILPCTLWSMICSLLPYWLSRFVLRFHLVVANCNLYSSTFIILRTDSISSTSLGYFSLIWTSIYLIDDACVGNRWPMPIEGEKRKHKRISTTTSLFSIKLGQLVEFVFIMSY